MKLQEIPDIILQTMIDQYVRGYNMLLLNPEYDENGDWISMFMSNFPNVLSEKLRRCEEEVFISTQFSLPL